MGNLNLNWRHRKGDISNRTVIPLKVKRNLWVGYATNFESWITFIVAFFAVL